MKLQTMKTRKTMKSPNRPKEEQPSGNLPDTSVTADPTLLSSAQTLTLHEWPGLFKVIQMTNGQIEIGLSPELLRRSMMLATGHTEPKTDLNHMQARAFIGLLGTEAAPQKVTCGELRKSCSLPLKERTQCIFDASQDLGMYSLFRMLTQGFRNALGADELNEVLSEVSEFDKKKAAADKVKKQFGEIIDSFYLDAGSQVHGRTLMMLAGQSKRPIGWHLIQQAKRLITKFLENGTPRLPTKAELKRAIKLMRTKETEEIQENIRILENYAAGLQSNNSTEQNPSASEMIADMTSLIKQQKQALKKAEAPISERQWNHIFKSAGLDSLPKETGWTW